MGSEEGGTRPRGFDMPWHGLCLGPLENMKAWLGWRGAEPSGLAVANTQTVTL